MNQSHTARVSRFLLETGVTEAEPLCVHSCLEAEKLRQNTVYRRD
ncbi:hypothetical protein [Oscillatoria sp. FACHB-1407]